MLVDYLKNADSCILDGTQEFHSKKFLVLAELKVAEIRSFVRSENLRNAFRIVRSFVRSENLRNRRFCIGFNWSAILQLLFTPETLLYFGLDLCNTDKTVDYNTERKVLSVRENRTKCIIIIGFLYNYRGGRCSLNFPLISPAHNHLQFFLYRSRQTYRKKSLKRFLFFSVLLIYAIALSLS